ncbi:non-ribosomal peptide synthetase [Massilia aurea]|uniref:non-ribosomal peptide synthetase n=1 Tax=Massilia aurea TaxID=373040 RepID=UPI002161A63D|nr:non-ribosomal peptide synthetase [Massilia aurea]MCS0710057.1 amino acid adenylation domain-containing protein [Massilia aurea]
MSLTQQRLWVLDQLDHNAASAYHMPAALRLQGCLQVDALSAALDRIVARHEILRTCFADCQGHPYQQIGPTHSGFNLCVEDLRHLYGHEQESAVSRRVIDEASAPFNLSTGPLIRGRLLCLRDDEHVLLVTQHHIVSDGWSVGLLIQETSTLYTAFSQGLADPLPPLAIQYADYAVWQRQWLQGKLLCEQSQFWRSHLSGAPALLELPTDRPRPPVQSYAGGSVPLRLSSAMVEGLRGLAQRHGATMFVTLLAGWAALLARLSGQDDIVVGTPAANRKHRELESLIGCFVNTLALRVRVDAMTSGDILIEQVKATSLQAYSHQDLPFEEVVEAVNPPRSLSHSPLFQSMLTLNSGPTRQLNLPGLQLSLLPISERSVHFDLSLRLNEHDDVIAGGLEYSSELFDHTTAERFANYFQNLLAAMVTDPSQPVAQLTILSAAEQQQLLVDFNGPTVDYRRECLIHQPFEEQAARQPESPALVYRNQRLTYGELNLRANQLAHYLIAQGVVPETRVAICLERGLDMIVGLLAILKAGGAYVPLDPTYPRARLTYMLHDSAPAVVLTQSSLLEIVEGGESHVLVLDDSTSADLLASQPRCNPDPHHMALAPTNLAYVIYTSGSTGRPKGVMVEHRSAVNFWLVLSTTIYTNMPPNANVALNSPFSFDMSLKGILQLLSGHCLTIVPESVRASGLEFKHFLQTYEIDAFECTPTQFEVLERAGIMTDTSHHPKLVLLGGEAVSLPLWRKIANAPTTRFFNMYGPTECTVDATIGLIDNTSERPHIGTTISNAHVYLLDPYGQPVPFGVAGEIHIGGVGVARGYLNRPELTAERFLPDPFARIPGARMYKTGDLGRWLSNGNLEYHGRNDTQVKIRGFRIELQEIEAKLTNCDNIQEAVVMVREDNPGDTRLVAYLLPKNGTSPSVTSLRAALAETLPNYMVPSAFVTIYAFPLNPNGKLDRKALPPPDLSAVACRDYEAPQGLTETIIAALWETLLGIDRVGRNDHFFELGGHSLLAVHLISRASQAGLSLTLGDLITNPVLSKLSAAINDKTKRVSTRLVPVRTSGTHKPLFLVHAAGGTVTYVSELGQLLDMDMPVYGLRAAGLEEGEVPRTSVEAMADDYLAEMRQVQPVGPYFLGGYSFGGLVAYEIANRLIAAGESVAFLGLIDTALPVPLHYDEEKGIDEFFSMLRYFGRQNPETLGQLRKMAETRDIERMLDYCYETGLLPREIERSTIRRRLATLTANHIAKAKYWAPKINTHLTLFSAEGESRQDCSIGWRKFYSDNLSIHTVPGNHASMMDWPNIEHLGNALGRSLQTALNNEVSHPEAAYRPAVVLQAGQAGFEPIIIIPGAGGSVTAFVDLAQQLDARIPLLGLQPRGLCGQLAPYLDVEVAATAYLAAIREHYPQGPYNFAGHSYGGWIAFEVARQLSLAGERVNMLMLLDSRSPNASHIVRAVRTHEDVLLELIQLYEMNYECDLNIVLDDLRKWDKDEQVDVLLARLVNAGIFPSQTRRDVLAGIIRVFETNINTRYTPKTKYTGELNLVYAFEPTRHNPVQGALAKKNTVRWDECSLSIKEIQVEANHMTLLRSPQNHKVVRHIHEIYFTK